MTSRRLPRWGEVAPLIGRPVPGRSLLQARLERCSSIGDLRVLARKRAPRAVFDYTDGAAMSETSLQRSREAYRRVEFSPRVLMDVADVDMSVEMLGTRSALPFAVLALLFGLVGAGIAAWHVRLLQAPESLSCGPGLHTMLENFPLTQVLPRVFAGSGDCTDASAVLFGVSLPLWSLIGFCGLMLLVIAAMPRAARARRHG